MLESLPWLVALAIVCATAAFWRYRSGIEHIEKLRHEHLRDEMAVQRHLADAKVNEVRASGEMPVKAAEAESRRFEAEQRLIAQRCAAAEKELVREEKRAAMAAKKSRASS